MEDVFGFGRSGVGFEDDADGDPWDIGGGDWADEVLPDQGALQDIEPRGGHERDKVVGSHVEQNVDAGGGKSVARWMVN